MWFAFRCGTLSTKFLKTIKGSRLRAYNEIKLAEADSEAASPK